MNRGTTRARALIARRGISQPRPSQVCSAIVQAQEFNSSRSPGSGSILKRSSGPLRTERSSSFFEAKETQQTERPPVTALAPLNIELVIRPPEKAPDRKDFREAIEEAKEQEIIGLLKPVGTTACVQPVSGREKSKLGSSVQDSIDQVKALEKAGKQAKANEEKQKAIDEAIKVYAIHTANVKSITYDPTVKGEAVTSKDGTVRIGDKAFRNGAWLGSSIAHECEVHVDKQAMQGKWYTGAEGTAVQEVEAYDYELANAKRFGTNSVDQEDLRQRRQDYYDQLSPKYQKRVNAHPPDYEMKPGDEKK